MGLISTRQYDRAMRFLSDVARTIRTSPPVKVVRKLHSQSFQEVQQVQAEIERYYQIQYRSVRSRPVSPSSRTNRPDQSQATLPAGRPQSLPPESRQPLGQLPPYRPNISRPGQQPPPRPEQSPRYPQRQDWQQRRPEQQNR